MRLGGLFARSSSGGASKRSDDGDQVTGPVRALPPLSQPLHPSRVLRGRPLRRRTSSHATNARPPVRNPAAPSRPASRLRFRAKPARTSKILGRVNAVVRLLQGTRCLAQSPPCSQQCRSENLPCSRLPYWSHQETNCRCWPHVVPALPFRTTLFTTSSDHGFS